MSDNQLFAYAIYREKCFISFKIELIENFILGSREDYVYFSVRDLYNTIINMQKTNGEIMTRRYLVDLLVSTMEKKYDMDIIENRFYKQKKIARKKLTIDDLGKMWHEIRCNQRMIIMFLEQIFCLKYNNHNYCFDSGKRQTRIFIKGDYLSLGSAEIHLPTSEWAYVYHVMKRCRVFHKLKKE